MPSKKSKSSLSAKLGSEGRSAYEAHKGDETRLTGGGGDLPPGIDSGIAQLVDCKFDLYKTGDNVGEFFFYAAGIVKQPKKVKDIPVEGLRTNIMETMCVTEGRKRESIEDHLDWVLNEFRKLGVDTTESSFDDLEDVAASLKEAQPHFRFRTWQGEPTKEYPNPRVNHDWRGVCEYEEDDSAAEDAVEDSTDGAEDESDLDTLAVAADGGDQEAQNKIMEAAEAVEVDSGGYDTWAAVVEAIGEAGSAKPAPKKKSKPAPKKAEPEEEEEEEKDDSDISLQDLGGMADDDGDEDAMEKLAQAAAEAELDPNDYPSWAELADALVEARIAGEEEEEEEEWKPEKMDVCFYKTNPKAKKSTECEVTAVFEAKKLVNLKSLDDDKVFKAVPWSALEHS
jgi:hypothetical protein